jgi:NAD(P)-dependent dehydrogenase (short-subunit alcohol dehydrogenase family)
VAADALADRRHDRSAQALSGSGRLAGKRVLLTGASSGIGSLAAGLFAAEGARLALLARGGEALDRVVAEHGIEAHTVGVDVTDRAGTERAVAEAVTALGGLDVLVSNAAAGAFGHFLEVDADDFDRSVAITFTGAVNVVRAALPHLRASRGTIVATASVLSRVPQPSWSSYGAGKHALRGFLNAVAIEEREQRSGVSVALVLPGVVDTPFFGTATSATGRAPRVPPLAYAPEVVARALVENAVRPRREVLLGGATIMFERAFLFARPVSERMLVLLDRWFRSGDAPPATPGSLHQSTEEPHARGGIPSRESILAPAQLGGEARTSARAPLALLRRLGDVAAQTVRLLGTLRRPVPERGGPQAEPGSRSASRAE